MNERGQHTSGTERFWNELMLSGLGESLDLALSRISTPESSVARGFAIGVHNPFRYDALTAACFHLDSKIDGSSLPDPRDDIRLPAIRSRHSGVAWLDGDRSIEASSHSNTLGDTHLPRLSRRTGRYLYKTACNQHH